MIMVSSLRVKIASQLDSEANKAFLLLYFTYRPGKVNCIPFEKLFHVLLQGE